MSFSFGALRQQDGYGSDPIAVDVISGTSKFLAQIRSAFLVCLLGIGLFFTPVFQSRFFPSGEGDLGQVAEGDYNDAGRREVWASVWEESKHHILLGAGVGESDIFVSSRFKYIGKVHNDYLRIFFEFGLVGFILFLILVSTQMIQLFRMVRREKASENAASAAAFLAMCSWLLLSYTDNGILYGVHFTHLIFAIIGAAYGLERKNI